MRIDAPSNIRKICNVFIEDFNKDEIEILPPKYSHNHTWRESSEELANITSEILESLSDIWRNPAFEANIAKTQSEGTYVTDMIVPLLRASLKKTSNQKYCLSYVECQSQASADRKGGENKSK
ncbi:hypothetical protein F8M41_015492 [Gigaspora margarita]|uniref:Uncharacterized protein n=1 Tax=Gigaspora margarita TaxID=4874 RepID=A0A8H3WWH0_GIGMA|nr:hypothetical protein F8M41_015492 [Gigaspora margarita]